MKKIALIFASLLCAISVLKSDSFAQKIQSSEWIRVQSNNGEFLIEVPAKYSYFYDEDGFSESRNVDNYQLRKMSLLNAYYQNTLLSFESYEAKKGGFKALYEHELRASKEASTSDFNRNGAPIKQIITKTDNYYCVRQYFNSKTNVYILTAVARSGENEVIKRFLDSLVFKPETKEKPDTNSILFSSLKVAPVNITTAKDDKKEGEKDAAAPTDKAKKDISKFVVAKKPATAYVDAARMRQIKGTIKLRVTFGEDGFIPQIEIVKSLPEGLLRQAVFAALRLKFLPEEAAGKPISVTKMVEYRFDIY